MKALCGLDSGVGKQGCGCAGVYSPCSARRGWQLGPAEVMKVQLGPGWVPYPLGLWPCQKRRAWGSDALSCPWHPGPPQDIASPRQPGDPHQVATDLEPPSLTL